MLNIALPLAAASYARSGLSTLQHLLVPKGLRISGLSAAAALAGYGIIQGMALPVVLFPSCLMMALAELIVPKLTAAQVSGRDDEIRSTSASLLRRSAMFSFWVAFMCFAFGDSLGLALYSSEAAGHYIRIFSLIVPVMYLDMIADGCLKGLGEMMFCMAVNILDAGLSALLVWLLLPRWGLPAYIFVIAFTEAFNFFLSLLRLRKVSGWCVDGKVLGLILFAGGTSAIGARALYEATSAGNGVPALVWSIFFGLFLYLALINMHPRGIKPEEEAGRRACR